MFSCVLELKLSILSFTYLIYFKYTYNNSFLYDLNYIYFWAPPLNVLTQIQVCLHRNGIVSGEMYKILT